MTHLRFQFTDRRKRAAWRIALIWGIACSGLPGCAPSASPQLRTAAQSVSHQDSASALRQADQALRTARSPNDRAAAYYVRALARLQQADRTGARADLQAAAHERPERALAARIEAQAGNLDFEDGFYKSAASRYAACVDALPRRAPTDRVLFQFAAAQQRCGDFRAGDETYRKLAREYPASPLAAQASRKADWRANAFTVQCGAYRDEASARAAASALRSKGFTARVVRAPQSSSLPWAIHCGQFSRFADAARLLTGVQTVQADAFIVP